MTLAQGDKDLIDAFVSSDMGYRLNRRFPVGSLHRSNLMRVMQWQQRYHPVVKHRTPKKRKRRGR